MAKEQTLEMLQQQRSALDAQIHQVETAESRAAAREEAAARLEAARAAELEAGRLIATLRAGVEKINAVLDTLRAVLSEHDSCASALRSLAHERGIGDGPVRLVPMGRAFAQIEALTGRPLARFVNPSADLRSALEAITSGLRGAREAAEARAAQLDQAAGEGKRE